MSTNKKLLQARDMIRNKRYVEARKLLETVDHPTASKWLAEIDRIEAKNAVRTASPSSKRRKQRPPKSKSEPRQRSGRGWLFALVTGIIGFAVGLGAGVSMPEPDDPNLVPISQITRQFIVDANSTTTALEAEATSRAEAGPSDMELTATAIIELNATTSANIMATNLAATMQARSTPTPTSEAVQSQTPTESGETGPDNGESAFPFANNSGGDSGGLPFNTGGSNSDSSGGLPFQDGNEGDLPFAGSSQSGDTGDSVPSFFQQATEEATPESSP